MSLAIIGTVVGQANVCVHHFEATPSADGTLSTDDLARAWATSVGNYWMTNLMATWLAMHTLDYSLNMVRAQVVERPALTERALTAQEITTGLPAPGTIGANAEDLSTSVVLKWKTNIAGKSHRGRTYVGPLSATQSDEGKLVAAQVTLYQAYIDQMKTRFMGAGVTTSLANLTIYSRPYSAGQYQYTVRDSSGLHVITPPDYVGNSTNVIDGALDTTLRTQRRRQLGVGS